MKPVSPRAARSHAAFSLVEVALALGIIGFALVAILGLLSVGINSSRSSVDETTVSFIAQDVFTRVRADVSTVGVPVPLTQLSLLWNGELLSGGESYALLAGMAAGAASPPVATACYDRNGSFLLQNKADKKFVPQNGVMPTPLYRASAFIRPLATGNSPAGAGTPPPYNRAAGVGVTPAFLAVTVQIGWPTTPTGAVPAAADAKKVYTFYLLKP